MKWYTINVFNGKEKSIKERIKANLRIDKLDNLVEKLITPKEKYIQVRKGKKVQSERLYFPGYIFIECDMTKEVISCINRTDGVITIMGKDTPTPMSKKEITNMLIKDKSDEVIINYDKLFNLNDKVKIVSGVFSNMFGTINKINSDRKSVNVIVKIFNRETPVDLQFEQIAKI